MFPITTKREPHRGAIVLGHYLLSPNTRWGSAGQSMDRRVVNGERGGRSRVEDVFKREGLVVRDLIKLYTIPLWTHGTWRSLVARLLWEQDVAGSNPVVPTT